MRCMLKLEIDTATGNRAITDGTLPKVMQQMMEKLQPEASYFGASDGRRTAYLFFDLANPSDIPPLLEPAFLNFEAEVELVPMMNLDDLQKGLAQLT